MRAPIPYFGNKSLVAAEIWRRFGNPRSYVEPFAGSLAVPLARPGPPGREVFNDADGYVVNFLRALKGDAIEVWQWAHDPSSELDVHARHKWLRAQPELRERLLADPLWFDAQIAGWWAWGVSIWIGGTATWCRLDKPIYLQLPRSVPGGVHRLTFDDLVWLGRRLTRAQLVCGDWSRVVARSYTTHVGETAVLLDPPYSEGADGLYSSHDKGLSARVREWAIEHGDDPKLLIALCGYDDEHTAAMPKSWSVFRWKTRGGYGAQRRDKSNVNGARERVWFSPRCLS